jgi:hypothetical protein
MAMQPTYDYESEQAELLRRQRIADAMTGAGLAPMQMPQQPGVKSSQIEILNKVMQSVLGAKQSYDVKQDRQKLGNRYAGDLKAGMKNFIDGISATAGNPTAVADESGGHAGSGMTPQDAAQAKQAAVLEAIASNHPVMRELGMSQMKAMTTKKEGLTAKDVFTHGDPETQRRLAAEAGIPFNSKPEKPIEVGGMLLDPVTKQIIKVQGDPPQQVKIDGDLYEINPSTGQYKKLDNAPKINISNKTNVLNAGQKAGFEAWSKSAAETVGELTKGARAATNVLSRMNQLEALTNAGTVAGPAAAPMVFMEGLANQLGVKVDKARLSNSLTFESEATRAWAEMMQAMGGARGLVKEESEKIASSLPALTQTPEGRKQIIALIRQQSQQAIADAGKASKEYALALNTQNPEAFTFGLSATQMPQSGALPSAPGSTAPGPNTVIPLDQYLKQKGVGR